MKPIGVQRKRVKGFNLPPNTVCVDRTSKWGNPFIVGEHGSVEECVKSFEYLCGGFIEITSKVSVARQTSYIQHAKKNIETLRGKNLACFCAIGKPCHRDVLLKIANQ